VVELPLNLGEADVTAVFAALLDREFRSALLTPAAAAALVVYDFPTLPLLLLLKAFAIE
jgi:hypothetical protein